MPDLPFVRRTSVSLGDVSSTVEGPAISAPEPTPKPVSSAAPFADDSQLLEVLALSVIVLVCYFTVLDFLGYRISPTVTLAIFVAAAVSSIAGFAFSAICGAILFHVLSQPLHVVEIMILCSIAIQSLSVVSLKRAIDLKHLARFLLGGVFGLPLGIYLLTHAPKSLYLKCIGVFLVGYGFYMLFRRPAREPLRSRLGDYAAGFLGGVTGGFAAFPGAFVTIWCGLKGWSKDQQRGVYQPFILIMQLVAMAMLFVIQASHRRSAPVDLSALIYVPAALLGTWCGIAVFRRLTDVQFAWSVNLLLVVSGLGLLA